MNKVELNSIWIKVLDKAFFEKRIVSYELKKESLLESYDKDSRAVYIIVNKEYAKKLIIYNAKLLKDSFPVVSNLLVDSVYVNGVLADQVEIKELPGNKIDQNKIIDKEGIIWDPISQNLTQEEVLDYNFFLLKNEEEFLEKAKTIKITFYNRTFNKSKELFVKTNIYHRNYLLIISAIFFFTIIIPCFLIIEYYRRKNLEKSIKLEIEELLLFGYEPEDKQTKKFIKLHQLPSK